MSEYRSITGRNFLDHTVEETFISDDGRVYVEKTQDCTAILEGIKAARDLPKGRFQQHVGSIPIVMVTQWMREAGIPNSSPDYERKKLEVIQKKLMSGEFSRLVVWGY